MKLARCWYSDILMDNVINERALLLESCPWFFQWLRFTNHKGSRFKASSLPWNIDRESVDVISVFTPSSMCCRLLNDGLWGPFWLLSTVASKQPGIEKGILWIINDCHFIIHFISIKRIRTYASNLCLLWNFKYWKRPYNIPFFQHKSTITLSIFTTETSLEIGSWFELSIFINWLQCEFWNLKHSSRSP